MTSYTVQEFLYILQSLGIEPIQFGENDMTSHGYISQGARLGEFPAQDLLEALGPEDLSAILESQTVSNDAGSSQRDSQPIAWYRPYHFDKTKDKSEWGIFISTSRLEAYVITLLRLLVERGVLSNDTDGLAIAFKLALASVEAHETFHHRVENMVSRQELLAERIIYSHDIYTKTKALSVDLEALAKMGRLQSGLLGKGILDFPISHLEEALCNAHGSNVRVLRKAKAGLTDEQLAEVSTVMHQLDEGLTGGYEHGDKFQEQKEFKLGVATLIEGYFRAAKSKAGCGPLRDNLYPREFPIRGLRPPVFKNDGGTLGAIFDQILRFGQKLTDELNEESFRGLVKDYLTSQNWTIDVDAELELDERFIPSIRNLRFKDAFIRGNIVRCCGNCLVDIKKLTQGHTVDKSERAIKNATGHTAQRRYVKRCSPAAARLHAWHGNSPTLVALNVATHDDYKVFETFKKERKR